MARSLSTRTQRLEGITCLPHCAGRQTLLASTVTTEGGQWALCMRPVQVCNNAHHLFIDMLQVRTYVTWCCHFQQGFARFSPNIVLDVCWRTFWSKREHRSTSERVPSEPHLGTPAWFELDWSRARSKVLGKTRVSGYSNRMVRFW
jgi:hypothetical protein